MRPCHGVDARFRLADLGQPEVQDLGFAVPGDEDVGRFDVPVDDLRCMGRSERVRHLQSDLDHALDRKRPAPDPVLEGLALHQLHHEERLTFVLADVVDRADVGVVERRGGPGLRLEPLKSRAIVCQLLR